MTHPAIAFLSTLDPSPESKFNIETYTDLPKGAGKPKPDPLANRCAELRLDDVQALIPTLKDMNDRGAGIFFAVNECAGHRKKDSITRVRCLHADLDGVQGQDRDRLRACLEPSIEVQTSGPDNQHWYWLLEDGEELSAADAERLNRQMVMYGADPAAVDASRLLRLPGFRHMKFRSDGLTPLVTTLNTGPSYSVAELMEALQPAVVRTTTASPSYAPTQPQPGVYGEQWADIAEAVGRAHPELWKGDWTNPAARRQGVAYNSQSQADLALAGYIAKECARARVSKPQWHQAVEAVFERSGLAARSKWRDRSDYRDATIERALDGVTELPQELLDPNSHGDIRNAKAFALRAVGRLLYVTTRDRWLIWK